jgi:hypothetical protein
VRIIYHLVKWVLKESGLIVKGSRIQVKSVEKAKEFIDRGYSIERVEYIQTRGEKKNEVEKEKGIEEDRILF